MGTRGRPRHPDTLTPRQQEVLELIGRGLTNREIAEQLDITFDAAKFHVSEILGRTGASSRQEAVEWLRRRRQPAALFRRTRAPSRSLAHCRRRRPVPA